MKKLNNSELYQLLHIIYNNGNIRRLIRKEITFIQITNTIKSLISDSDLSFVNGKIMLTEKGLSLFNSLSSNYKISDKDKWIEEENKSKLENKIDLDFVYLPNPKELYF